MNRRLIGGAAVVLAVMALIVVNRVHGRDIPGQAVAAAPIDVPAVGTCIRYGNAFIDAVDSGTSVGAGSPDASVVPCSVPHHAEVLRAWRADPADHQTGVDPAGGCGITLVTPTGGHWEMPPVVTDTLLVDVGGPIGWSGCLWTPMDADHRVAAYTGRLTDLSTVADLPAGLRPCFGHRGRGASAPESSLAQEPSYPGYEWVPCGSPHAWELIGVKPGAADPVGCRKLARELVDSSAPFDSDVGLQVQDLVDYTGGAYAAVEIVGDGPGDRTGAALVTASGGNGRTCAVGAPAGWLLTGSVVGLGDAELPLSGG